MSFVVWIMIGLMVGSVGDRLVRKKGKRVALDRPLGILGAVVSGLAFNSSAFDTANGLNPISILGAAVGSVFVLTVYHWFFRKA